MTEVERLQAKLANVPDTERNAEVRARIQKLIEDEQDRSEATARKIRQRFAQQKTRMDELEARIIALENA